MPVKKAFPFRPAQRSALLRFSARCTVIAFCAQIASASFAQTPPANPLTLPSAAQEPDNKTTPRNGADRATPERNERPAPDSRLSGRVPKPLPIFGFNFFEPARQALEARRQLRMGKGNLAAGALNGMPAPEEEATKPNRKNPNEKTDKDESDDAGNKPRRNRQNAPKDDPKDSDKTNGDDTENRDGEQEDQGENRPRNDKRRPVNPDRELEQTRQALREEENRRRELEQKLRTMEERQNGNVNAFNEIADPISQMMRNITASVPATYQLWGGDRLLITFRSPTLAEREFTSAVDPMGNIELNGDGRLNVRGMTLAQAENAIRTRLSRIYRNLIVSVQLRELRTIAVLVSGQVFEQGTYTVPSVATAFNVLYAAGGPTEEGSMRRIEVRRQGRIIGTLDFYKILTAGDQPDIPLQSGDIISVPSTYARVAVSGEVRNPAQFELLDGETLADTLRYAGGIKPSGVSQSIQISTLDPGRERQIKTVDLSQQAARQQVLHDGDAVEIFSLRPVLANRVTVEGAVDVPGDYALQPGMRVSDLISRARNVLPEAYLTKADLIRWNPDTTTTLIAVDLEKALQGDPQANVALSKWDKLRVYTRQEVAWTGKRRVEIRGAVKNPNVYLLSQNMRVSDLLRQAGGPAPDAFLERAYVVHQRGDGTFESVKFSLLAQRQGAADHDPMLEDNDLVAIYSVSDANFTPERSVTLVGEVNRPGPYRRTEGMRLSELIEMAGGFKPGSSGTVTVAHARRRLDAQTANNGNTTLRVSFDVRGKCDPKDDVALEDGDLIAVQADGAFTYSVPSVKLGGAVRRPGTYPISKKEMRLSELIQEAGGLRPEAFPEGAQFSRSPKELTSQTQSDIVRKINELNTLLNESEMKRLAAQQEIQRIKAIGAATQSNGGVLGGLTGNGGAPPVNQAAIAAAAQAGRFDLVTPPRVLKDADLLPNGNIAVKLIEAMQKPGGAEDVVLKDGDAIYIPETPTTIQFDGAVVYQRSVLYRKGASFATYLNEVGGYTVDAAQDKVVVVRSSGAVIPLNKVGALRPGDYVYIPTKVLTSKLNGNGNPTENIFKNLANTALSGFFLFRLFGL